MTKRETFQVIAKNGKTYDTGRRNTQFPYKKEYDPFYKIFAINRYAKKGDLVGVHYDYNYHSPRSGIGPTNQEIFNIFFMGDSKEVAVRNIPPEDKTRKYIHKQADVSVPVTKIKSPYEERTDIGYLSLTRDKNSELFRAEIIFQGALLVNDRYDTGNYSKNAALYKNPRYGNYTQSTKIFSIFFNQEALEDKLEEKGIELEFSLDKLKVK